VGAAAKIDAAVTAARVGRKVDSGQACRFSPTAAAAGGQSAHQRGGHDGGSQNALHATGFGMGMHDELLWLNDSGVETTRYRSSCINHAKFLQTSFKVVFSAILCDKKRIFINEIGSILGFSSD
ncbi:hypothetical protein, partial [Achromobacter anxifer]|uniref:hypothetical protein n=1 Tax=Achromobacter anxifer TaxID=1287737 RepID=UPI0023F9E41D